MNERDYQPSLLWVKSVSWLQAQDPEREIGSTDINLFVYRTDKVGAYSMHNTKLYWTDTPMSGGGFRNCDQDDLYKQRNNLGEVVLWDRRLKKTQLIGNDYESAWKKISGQYDNLK